MKWKWAASSFKTCAKMPVAQFHQLSHIESEPAPSRNRRAARENEEEGRTATFPHTLGRRPPFSERRAKRRRNGTTPHKEASRSDTSLFRIRGEKGSNFVQESAQIREKLGIARKRRKHITMRRAGRHSSPDPSCRPARIIVGVFGDFRNEGEGGTRRKNEGAVAEESDSHRLCHFSSQTQIAIITVTRSGPLPLQRTNVALSSSVRAASLHFAAPTFRRTRMTIG